MTSYNIHAGHCPQDKGAYGAVGILKESVEDRLVKDEVIRLLRQQGHTVYDCTVDYSTTQSGCLQGIVNKCNQHIVALDVSIHLNSGRNDYAGDGNTGGTEVFNYDSRTSSVSDRICNNISNALGIRNRGSKYTKNLYVLNNTKNLAILIECCFVDDRDDADKWNYKKCAHAIASGILGHSIPSDNYADSSLEPLPPAPVPSAPASTPVSVKYQVFSANKWWSDVIDYNTTGCNGYAGVIGSPMLALRANTIGNAAQAGFLEYRAHCLGGGWYNWQRDRQMDANHENFAGTCKTKLDGLQMRLISCPGCQVKYRVHCIDNGWLPWVTGYSNNPNGYAGLYGSPIDVVQIQIISI